MLVSVIIPACDAQRTIVRAVRSVSAQTMPEWEAIIVSDDGFDYREILGTSDQRLRFVSTGKTRSGCHNARNVGFAHTNGDFVTQLDADDELLPNHLSALLPLAKEHGAAADNLACVSDDTGNLLYRVLGDAAEAAMLDVTAFLALSAPLVPLVRRDHAQPRTAGVEMAEDVIANLRLIDRIGTLPVVPASSYRYRIIAGSICHDADSERMFDEAYTRYIERIKSGDGFGLSAASRSAAARGLSNKRDMNRAFGAARKANPALTFQDYAARLRTAK